MRSSNEKLRAESGRWDYETRKLNELIVRSRRTERDPSGPARRRATGHCRLAGGAVATGDRPAGVRPAPTAVTLFALFFHGVETARSSSEESVGR